MAGPEVRGLRVGLTGGPGSGKSTVAAMLAAHGAHVLSADELARQMMQPGEDVYAGIVAAFGPEVVRPDGTLDRPALARLAFAEGRLEGLNRIVHPATIARQAELSAAIFAADPRAIVVVESALIFETKYSSSAPDFNDAIRPWRERFDRLILVTAPEYLKIARFVARSGSGDQAALEAEARRRLAQMIPDEQKLAQVDRIIRNDGTLAELQAQADAAWSWLCAPVPY